MATATRRSEERGGGIRPGRDVLRSSVLLWEHPRDPATDRKLLPRRVQVAEVMLAGVGEQPPADIHASDKRGRTALHMAAEQGHAEMVALLLAGVEGGRGGANITCRAESGMSALEDAAANGHVEVVELLLKGLSGNAVADAARGDSQGMTALHHATLNGHIDTVRLIIRELYQHGPNASGLESAFFPDKSGQSTLHLAARSGHVAIVRFFLEISAAATSSSSSAEVMRRADNRGLTPLHAAAQGGCAEAARLLIERYRSVNASAEALLLDRDDEGKTVLHHAAQVAAVDVVELLLGMPPPRGATTPRGRAVAARLWKGKDEAVQSDPATSSAAAALIFSRDLEGRTALHCAAASAPVSSASPRRMSSGTDAAQRMTPPRYVEVIHRLLVRRPH